jgi:hypothetical protein
MNKISCIVAVPLFSIIIDEIIREFPIKLRRNTVIKLTLVLNLLQILNLPLIYPLPLLVVQDQIIKDY